MNDPLGFLVKLFQAAVTRAQPLENMKAFLPEPPRRGRTLVLGAGKAAGAMAHALEAMWPQDAPMGGLVVTRYGHVPPRPAGLTSRIEIVEAAHPVPDEAGLQAARRTLALTEGLMAEDLVICLISGGGSASLALPVDGMTLADMQAINRRLLESGAQIAEMNCVRKHISQIKGGRLAAACQPARIVTLAISDVPSDDAAIIASGPTVADATTCAQALDILDRYGIDVPPLARARLEQGELETPKPGDKLFDRSVTHMIATPRASLGAAAEFARAAGIPAYILSDEMEGESREVGKVHAALARSMALHSTPFAPPCVILSGGETTVTVKGRPADGPKGRGGRAGEFCMGLAAALDGHPGIWGLAADTDGIDGSEDNAGAFVTPDTLKRADAKGLRLADYLDTNDSYGYFSALDDLLTTGPTHTNVNDFRALLIL